MYYSHFSVPGGQKSTWPVTSLENKGLLKALNVNKLVLDKKMRPAVLAKQNLDGWKIMVFIMVMLGLAAHTQCPI